MIVNTMQAANRLKTALDEGKGASMGAWQMLPGSNLSRVAAQCGFDWIMVDCEHGNIDDAAMHECVAAIAACGVSPIVRVSDFQGWMIKRALDAGAHGILAPLLRTTSDAKAIVMASKFPPLGQRGFGSPFPMAKFDARLSSTDYLRQANAALITAVQIETKEALENVDEIAAIDGIDVLFVGPFDLGNNIGHPIEDGEMHEDLQAALVKILESAVRAGKKAGIFCSDGEQGRTYAEMGFHMVNVATDVAALMTCFTSELAKAGGKEGGKIKLAGPYGK